MKVQIRNSAFETNSSSVHTLVMCNESYYNGWVDGIYKFCQANDKFLPTEEADVENERKTNKYNKEYSISMSVEDYVNDNKYSAYLSFAEFENLFDEDFELYKKTFNGVVAFGFYGYD